MGFEGKRSLAVKGRERGAVSLALPGGGITLLLTDRFKLDIRIMLVFVKHLAM